MTIIPVEESTNSVPISHPMITRSKAGIFKKKVFTVSSSLTTTEPSSVREALSSAEWTQAMSEEYNALMLNQTWTLVPPHPQMKVVDNKWVFRIKYYSDGSIQRYKALWWHKAFNKHLVLISLKPLVK